MKFVSYQAQDERRTGVLRDGRVLDVSEVIDALPLAQDAAAALAQRGIAPAASGLMRWLPPARPRASAPSTSRRSGWLPAPVWK